MILVMNPLKMRRLVLRKIIMRKGIFWGYFPDNPQDKFYQSGKFKHLLNYLTQNPSQAQLKEKNNQLLMRKDNMESVEEVNEVLELIIKN